MHQEMNLPSVVTWYPFIGLAINYPMISVSRRRGTEDARCMKYLYFNLTLHLPRYALLEIKSRSEGKIMWNQIHALKKTRHLNSAADCLSSLLASFFIDSSSSLLFFFILHSGEKTTGSLWISDSICMQCNKWTLLCHCVNDRNYLTGREIYYINKWR